MSIKIINASKNYLNKTFNFEFNLGNKYLIVGENGIGKSTLIKLLCNYIKPDKGIVESKIKQFYLQENFRLPNNIKVIDYIKIYSELIGSPINSNLFDLFNLPLNKFTNELSKGNKQKLGLLVALSFNNGFIILDEPLNGLDNNTKKELIKLMKKLNKSFIIVTHFPKDYKDLKADVVYL